MEDVRAMKKVFTTATLTPILTNLTLRTKESIEKVWSEKRNDRSISQQYIAKMGKRCSEKLAICLHEKSVTYDQLHEAFQAYSAMEFDDWLKKSGVRLKKWRNNIQIHFSSHTKSL